MEFEAKLFLSTFVTHCNGYEIRSLYGPPPNPMDYLPHTLDEWKIHLFNLHHTRLARAFSFVAKTEMAKWILTTSTRLNLKELINFFTETSQGLEVLSLVTETLIERNKENFIECFRDYLLTTGAITLINETTNNIEDSSSASPSPSLALPASPSLKLERILEIFCSALLLATQTSQDHLQILIELCHCVLTLNHAILTGQEAYSLPMFFETVRKITSQKLQIFSARELSSLYNTLRTNGPFETTPPLSLRSSSPIMRFPLLSSPIFVTIGSVLFYRQRESSSSSATSLSSLLHASSAPPSHDPIFQTRRIYLTARGLYLDPWIPTPSSDPSVASASVPHLECIPLEGIRFLRSERDPLVCELHPSGDRETEEMAWKPSTLAVIEYQFITTTTPPPSPEICVSFYQTVFLKFRPLASEDHFRLLDDCIWRLRSRED
jgi:hypothetical protein